MIRELEAMCKDVNFDVAQAKELLNRVDINQEFTGSKIAYGETLLTLAVSYSNLPFVMLLLEHGADPNLLTNDGTDSALWELQYAEEDERENEIRLQIAELLLQHGANPRIKADGEELLVYAIGAQMESLIGVGTQFAYREKFIALLERYDT